MKNLTISMIFFRSPVEKNINLLEFWSEKNFGNLNKLALDIYGCPASSAGIESIFSEMKSIITDGRRSLTVNHLCHDQLLKNWKITGNF